MARVFDGSSQYLSYAPNPTGSAFSFAFWMYRTSSADSIPACVWYQVLGRKAWYLYIISNAMYFGHSTDGSTGVNLIHSTSLSTSTWYSVVASFASGTSKGLAINGTWETASAPGTIYSTTEGLRIAAIGNASLYFAGRIAYAAHWSAALNQAEAEAYCSGYHPRMIRPSALVSSWDLGGFAGEHDKDFVGGYDLTATDNPTWADSPRIIWPDDDGDVVTAASAPAATPWLYSRRGARLIGGGLS